MSRPLYFLAQVASWLFAFGWLAALAYVGLVWEAAWYTKLLLLGILAALTPDGPGLFETYLQYVEWHGRAFREPSADADRSELKHGN